METLTGTWTGFFTQLLGNEDDRYVAEFEFRMEITENENGFTGKCWDMEIEEGENEVSNIRGFRDGNMISFIKEYDNLITYDDKTDELVLDKESDSNEEIHYFGTFDSEKKAFIGEWEIKLDETKIPEGFDVEMECGDWEMKKIK